MDSVIPSSSLINRKPERLPEALNMASVHSLSEAMQDVPAEGTLWMDASQVELVTAPGLQWLLALERKLQAAGGGLRISHLNDRVLEQLRMLGASEGLARWHADQGEQA